MPIYYKKNISLAGSFKPKVLFFGEGLSEVLFIDKVLQGIGIPNSDAVVYCIKGIGKIKKMSKQIAKEPNFKYVRSLGIMVDADTEPLRRLNTVMPIQKQLGFPVERDLMHDGIVVEHNGKKAGVFISPGLGQRGNIEILVLIEISTTDLSECLNSLEKCIKALSAAEFDAKGLVQCYISARRGNLCGLGHAFDAGIMDVGHTAYRVARQLVVTLANV